MNHSSSNDEFDELFDQIKFELLDIGKDDDAVAKVVAKYCAEFPDLTDRIQNFVKTLRMLEDLPNDSPAVAGRVGEIPAIHSTGDYRIVREIGRGGMGIVYEAEQESLGRRVALKVLPSTWIDGDIALERFKLEAQIAARMHHTNIVPIFEVGTDGQQWFYAMQLIDGESLDKLQGKEHCEPWSGESLARSHDRSSDARPFERIAEMGLQVAEALKYAHGRGVIHRDIKPSNLLIDRSGVVWITDFGLAKSDQENLTQTGDIPGTLRYMSPERFAGQCDERADLYALGLTMYELLTNRSAFGASGGLELINAIRQTTPKPPRSIDPSIPRDLETIVVHAMEKEPIHRYQNAAGMAADLHRFLDGEPIAARRAFAIERFYRWTRRRPGRAAALATIAALTLLIAIGSSVAALVFQDQRNSQRRLTDRAKKAENATQQHLYGAHTRLAGGALWGSGGVGRMRELTEQWRPEIAGVELRGWEWYFLRSYWGREQLDCQGPHIAVYSVDWSPDGTQFVESRPRAVDVRDALTGDVVMSLPTDSPKYSLRWSPDGTQIACGGSQMLSVWDLGTLSRRWIRPRAHTGRISSLDWNPQGTKLATTGADSQTKIWDADNGNLSETLDQQATRSSAVQWSPQGTELAFSGRDSQMWIWKEGSGRIVHLDGSADGEIESVSWHPDGSRVAAVNDRHSLFIWDTNSGAVVGEYDTVCNLHAVHWHPGGDRLAVCGWDGIIRVLDSSTLSEMRAMYGHLAQVWDVRWSPDGTQLLSSSSDGHVKVWREADVLDSRVLAEVDGSMLAACFGPDGRYLVAVGSPDHVLLFKDIGLRQIRWKGHGVGRNTVSWSRDRRTFATVSDQGNVEIWNTSAQEAITAGRGTAAVWNPAADELAIATQSGVSIIAAATGSTLRTIAGPRVEDVDWSPSGDRLAAASADQSILVWSAQGDRQLELQGHSESIGCVRWSPDGRRLASCSVDRSIRIWDGVTGRPLLTMRGHTRTIQSVCWSPDGDRLASASRDRTVRIWDAKNGDEVLAIPGHRDAVSSVDWSPDGMKLVSTSEGGEVKIWDASRCHLRQTK